MQRVESAELSATLDREVHSVEPVRLYSAAADLLRERGYRVEETEGPGVEAEPRGLEAEPRGFAATLRGERDTVLDARRRRRGNMLVGGAVLLTLVTFALMVTGEERRFVIEWLLTIDVLMGGLGLMFLKDPPKQVRSVVEVRVTGGGTDARLGIREGRCRIEEGRVIEWMPGEGVELGETELDGLAHRARGERGGSGA